MENAVKALYIAAGVLMGVMILSLAVVLYSSLQGYIENSNNEIRFNELTRFNAKYTKYINIDNGVKQFDLTIQDIVTVAGEAYENNSSYNPDTSAWNEEPNSLYISIYLNGIRIDKTINDEMVKLLKDNTGKTYQCASNNVEYSDSTGKIYSMSFSEYP